LFLGLSLFVQGCGGGKCKADEDCSAGFFCRSDGFCHAGCRINIECKLGEVCVNNECRTAQIDNDGDGWPVPLDCDDNDRLVNPAAVEICDNGKDDNCDGRIDEEPCMKFECTPGTRRDCYDGDPKTLEAPNALCRKGQQVCSNKGTWGDCQGQVLPTNELCDGIDNNCDGLIDRDEKGNPITRNCYSGPEGTANQGICRMGKQICTDGKWGECADEILPREETCNGLDDNCDGKVDNPDLEGSGCNTGQSGVCAKGRWVCDAKEQKLVCQQLEKPKQEVCGDGLDNDCDGVIDNGCLYVAQRIASLNSYPHTVAVSTRWAVVGLKDTLRIAIFDLYHTPPRLRTEVQLPEQPHGIQVIQDRAYVIAQKKLYKIDLELAEVEPIADMSGGSHAAGLASLGGQIYSRLWDPTQNKFAICRTNPTLKTVECGDISTNVSKVGWGIALWSSWAFLLSNKGIHVLDLFANFQEKMLINPLEPASDMQDIAIDNRTNRAVIADSGTLKIHFVEIKLQAIQKTLAFQHVPARVVAADGFAYVSMRDGQEIVVIDMSQSNIARQVKIGCSPLGLALSPSDAQKGRYLWITCPLDNELWYFPVP
jgi:hypothetical protein